MRYEVMVDDNFHDMDETERYKDGEFADATGAIARCREIVDAYLASASEAGMSASDLWDSYVSFGKDPFVTSVNMPAVRFSAWDYAKERCFQIRGAGIAQEVPSPPVPSDRERLSGEQRSGEASAACDGEFSVESIIDAAVVQAYREMDYGVRGDEHFTLRIGDCSPALAAVHRLHQAGCSAYITAFNPFSRALDDAANTERHSALGRELEQCGLASIEGVGQHPSNQWPGRKATSSSALRAKRPRRWGRGWSRTPSSGAAPMPSRN